MHCSRLAIRLLLAGFRSIDQVAGLSATAIDKLTVHPREQAMLARAISEIDSLAAQARAHKIRRDLGILDPKGGGPRSANELATTLTPEELARLGDSNKELEGLIKLKIQTGPREATAQLAEARKNGQTEQVKTFLAQKELQLRLQQQKKSLPQVAAGLRLGTLLRWGCQTTAKKPRCHQHQQRTFAVGWQCSRTLPPLQTTCRMCGGRAENSARICCGMMTQSPRCCAR